MSGDGSFGKQHKHGHSTRAATAKPFNSLEDFEAVMKKHIAGDMTDFDEDAFYRALKVTGSNKVLRRLQQTDITILRSMQADPQWTVLLTTLSEYEFGFQLLQATCRTIIVPVGGTLGSRGLWGPPGRLGYYYRSGWWYIRVEGSLGPTREVRVFHIPCVSVCRSR